jgi:hypothetical protein
MTNIFGTTVDTLVNGPAFSARIASLPNMFTRIQANWFEINPSAGVFNFASAPSCNDAMIATALAQGRTILFDVWGWPAWVQADWANRYQHMQDYVTAVLKHWPGVAILGCWNEPSFDQQPDNVLVKGVTGNTITVTIAQLMTEYHNLVMAIYNAKQAVNPKVQLNIGKFGNFQSYTPHMQLLKSLGTWAMGDYITWHDANDQFMNPAVDNPQTGTYSATPSVAHQCQWAAALFPGKMYGSDESYDYVTAYSVASTLAYRDNGASMLIKQYIPYPVPAAVIGQPIAAIYGTDANGNINLRSQAVIGLLTEPSTSFMMPIWKAAE